MKFDVSAPTLDVSFVFSFFFFKELYKPRLVRRPPEAFTKQVFAQAMAAMPRRREIRGFPTLVRRHLCQLEECLDRAVKAYPETKEAFRVLQQKVHVETDGMSAQIQNMINPKNPVGTAMVPLGAANISCGAPGE